MINRILHSDWEPFNGMAKQPWLMFWGLMFAILAWMAGCILLTISCFSYASVSNTQCIQTSFVDYSVDDDTLNLIGNDNEVYSVLYFQHYNGIFDNPKQLCNEELFTLYIDNRNDIKSLYDFSGIAYISFESEREAYRSSQIGAMILLPCILILTTGYFILAVCIGKNPEKYPNWLIKLVFAEKIFF